MSYQTNEYDENMTSWADIMILKIITSALLPSRRRARGSKCCSHCSKGASKLKTLSFTAKQRGKENR